MATPTRRAEAAAVSSTFHVAMAMLGARAFAEVLALWDQVVPMETRVATTGAKFVVEALKLVRLRRHQVQAIFIPYMRLTRALHTGYTTQPVFVAEPRPSLDKLRRDFVEAVRKYAPDALRSGEVEDYYTGDAEDDSTEITEPDGSPYTPYDPESWGPDGPVEVEDYDELDALLDEQEAFAEAEAERVIRELGDRMLERRLRERAEEKALADAEREAHHAKIGRRLAAHAERMVQNGGRHAEDAVARRDSRVIGYVRVHYPEGDPQPCSFCAMLLSRGVVYYSSKRAAEGRTTSDDGAWTKWRDSFEVDGAEFDKYHPLCHCRGEAVYSQSQYDEDDRFQVNRTLDALWKKEIRGKYSGKDAESRWRQIIKQRKAASQVRAEKE